MQFDGVIEAINQATVSAQTAGRVEELPFDVGDYVKQGDVIVRLTGTEQRARARSAEAALAEARARLAEAQLQHDRLQRLMATDAVSKAAMDKASADLASARARVGVADAALAEARTGTDYTVVKAPYPGIVVRRLVEVGESVAIGQPLMAGLSLEHLRAVVEVPQQHMGALRSHKKARVLLPDGTALAAAELRLPPSADPTTHTFHVLVTLPSGDHGVFPGSLVKVAFVSGSQDLLLAPADAIVRRGELTGAYVVGDDAHVSFRYLRVGSPAADGRIPILAGLQDGERLAVDPLAAAIAYKGLAP